MNKRFISASLLICLLITACSSKNTKVDLTDTERANEVEQQEVESNQVLVDKEVDIILYRLSYDNSSIEDYVAKLQEEEPDEIYSVYDDNHYIQTIMESERKDIVGKMRSDDYIAGLFKDVFSGEQYGGAFLSMEYDELLQNITFYADKNAYRAAGMSASYGTIIVAMMYSDTVQAYNLIPVDERVYNVLIIDEDTEEILYDSNE